MSSIKLAGKIAGILASTTFLIIGSIVLLNSMSLSFESVLNACKLSITAAFITGFLGYQIGKIFESSKVSKHHKSQKTKRKKSNSDLIIDDLLIDDLTEVNSEVE